MITLLSIQEKSPPTAEDCQSITLNTPGARERTAKRARPRKICNHETKSAANEYSESADDKIQRGKHLRQYRRPKKLNSWDSYPSILDMNVLHSEFNVQIKPSLPTYDILTPTLHVNVCSQLDIFTFFTKVPNEKYCRSTQILNMIQKENYNRTTQKENDSRLIFILMLCNMCNIEFVLSNITIHQYLVDLIVFVSRSP